ncbi:non-hydrolyzing UDP-N-acetylglucosamine 2-epimerase [Acinetobacter baumannii]|uniref:non-hydrolyzing UDP-N-acetylglucosamine 2-epimerase n=2 Tax=Acinetobacter baumannii TaxID=470 RepID=UPI001FB3E4E1|nr:UDP-N-acetylglucosamine 2-epimerase (non-hydrolyzing) [Acinetobacter baumannii]MCZ3025046.1 UDP-N-acetylglucosamine 2-epimerase (non-hydrolyzing) [Acinetobacter baumannii]MDC7318032.1 UDP-N-acetylglucosamine 2-epimerase (non-hydrolyzing) [Acinetobacter baumannii]MDC7321841.1 UDP-N-acetylglucosamine 2-epimerase (non-hydrolyzing) [Acinetobacter baumannii]MDC7326070.1 UDP-N-acetylglucosamine 2-epimerase (non-hydrolyzing) [Acinetobacter baumannii]MDC7329256.1 UDP-N-acetylglucosamine 2-epimerase
MMKILTVLGARPQFIKAAAFSRAVQKSSMMEEIIIHTGQHYDQNMSDVFFEEMDIPKPKYMLQTGGKTHGAMTGQQLEKIEEILLIEKPDIVLVYGDTNSTLAGALAAIKLHIPIAHVESGLRSFNRQMPEEINRILTDQISDYLFVPSLGAKENLLREGISENKIFVVGDIMYDVALYYKEKMIKPLWFDDLNLNKFVLCTIHRAENTDDPIKLSNILRGLELSQRDIILPLHPRTVSKLKQYGLNIPSNIRVVEPTGYLEMVWLEVHSELIVTDSGGVQKEAYFHNKLCVTLREETEWVELVNNGYNTLVGSNSDLISTSLKNKVLNKISIKDIYGNGDTAEKIVKILEKK